MGRIVAYSKICTFLMGDCISFSGYTHLHIQSSLTIYVNTQINRQVITNVKCSFWSGQGLWWPRTTSLERFQPMRGLHSETVQPMGFSDQDPRVRITEEDNLGEVLLQEVHEPIGGGVVGVDL